MRDLPTLAELLEAAPIIKGWFSGGMAKPTLQEATAAYVGEGWLIAQGYNLLGDGGATTQSVDCMKACSELDEFVTEANSVSAKKIGDGELLKRWGPILAPIFLNLLKKWMGG